MSKVVAPPHPETWLPPNAFGQEYCQSVNAQRQWIRVLSVVACKFDNAQCHFIRALPMAAWFTMRNHSTTFSNRRRDRTRPTTTSLFMVFTHSIIYFFEYVDVVILCCSMHRWTPDNSNSSERCSLPTEGYWSLKCPSKDDSRGYNDFKSSQVSIIILHS